MGKQQTPTTRNTFKSHAFVKNRRTHNECRKNNFSAKKWYEPSKLTNKSRQEWQNNAKSRNTLKPNQSVYKKRFVTLSSNDNVFLPKKKIIRQSLDMFQPVKCDLSGNLKDHKRIGLRSSVDRVTNSTTKSIQSVTIYKGPIANNMSINSPIKYSKSKSKHFSKQTSFASSKENKNLNQNPSPNNYARASTELQSPLTLRQSMGTDTSRLYKANSVLPGTSTLIVSQDIHWTASNNMINSCQTIASPYSSSTRSSLKRVKLSQNYDQAPLINMKSKKGLSKALASKTAENSLNTTINKKKLNKCNVNRRK